MQREEILKNIAYCRARLEEAATRYAPPQIMAVTKTQSAEAANVCYEGGIRRIGENRVQELTQKFPALNRGFTVELIGQLQTNKVKYILDSVARVQSLDRMALCVELDRRFAALGSAMPCLVEVNIARESQKSGVFEDDLAAFIKAASRLRGIRIEGLMTVAPLTQNPEEVRPCFRKMRTWFERIREMGIDGVDMNTLSMGMSGDYVVAAEEGSTLVRLGSALFGRRM